MIRLSQGVGKKSGHYVLGPETSLWKPNRWSEGKNGCHVMCSSLSDTFWTDRNGCQHWIFSDFSCLPYLIYHNWFSSFLFYLPLFLIISQFLNYLLSLFSNFPSVGFQYKTCSSKNNFSDKSTFENPSNGNLVVTSKRNVFSNW